MSTPISFPNTAVMGDALEALGANFYRFLDLQKKDGEEGTDSALEYAMAFFNHFAHEFPTALQAAVDMAAKLRELADGYAREKREDPDTPDWYRGYLEKRIVGGGFPTWLRNPQNVIQMDDRSLHLAIINNTFNAECDRVSGCIVEIAVMRAYPDGRKTVQRLGIRDEPWPKIKRD